MWKTSTPKKPGTRMEAKIREESYANISYFLSCSTALGKFILIKSHRESSMCVNKQTHTHTVCAKKHKYSS